MAGHSKWKNIRIRKGKQDALRGKLFTKLSREIIVAARMGGGDANMNLRLRIAIEKAKDSSMPRENIERAIDRGTGDLEGVAYEELMYEGYGPGGAALMLEVYTENKNRTVADIRHAFSKCGGNLAENGSVSWQFKHLGEIILPKDGRDEDEVTMAALEAGAEDVTSDDENYIIYTGPTDLHAVNGALHDAGYKTSDASLTYIATNKTEVGPEDMPKLIKLLDALEDLDDVQETYLNVDLTEEAFEAV